MAGIRNVEFRFHLEKDTSKNPTITPFPPSKTDFEKSPIWHFVDKLLKGPICAPQPSINIILTYDGAGRLPRDYDAMLALLRDLMYDLVMAEYEHVVVMLGSGSFGNAKERLSLRRFFEDSMGTATVVDGNEGRHLEFCPRELKYQWEEDQCERDFYMEWI